MANELQTTVTGRFIGGGLFTPKVDQSNPDRDPKHSACIVLDKGQEKKIQAIVDAAVAAKWAKKPGGLQDWGVRKGDDADYEASFEQFFINPKSTGGVKVLAKKDGKNEPTTREDGIIYPGCYVAVSVNAYAYDGNKERNIKPGVTLNLRGVLFKADGERLDDHMDDEEEFGGIEVDEVAVDEDDDFLA